MKKEKLAKHIPEGHRLEEKKNQSTVTLIPVRKSLIHPRNKRITCEKDNDVGRTRMGGKYASVGQEGVGYR
jgi:hypothetical protein